MRGCPRLIKLALGMAFASAVSCSHSTTTSSAGASSTPTTPTPASDAQTFTITASGVTPKTIVVPPGSQVTFLNRDAVEHEMSSDPHPEHTDCPALDQVGFLLPGQSRQSGNLNVVRTCGFHDHEDPFNESLKGSIVIR